MQNLLVIPILILIIGLLVFVHELGHFLAAKLTGVGVLEFALGFGPLLWQKKVGETSYQIRLLPLGGYVSLEGEDRSAASNSATAFWTQSAGKKLLILLSGVTMNFLLAVVLSSFYLQAVGHRVVLQNLADYNFSGLVEDQSYNSAVFISAVSAQGAAVGNLQAGDLVLKFNDAKLHSVDDFLQQLDLSQGSTINLEVTSDIVTLESHQVSIFIPQRVEQQPLLGATVSAVYILQYQPVATAGLSNAFNTFGYQIKVIAQLVQQAFAQRQAQVVFNELGSAVAVGKIVEQIIITGQYSELLNLTIAVSLALAFFNVLPLPALDGGQAMVVVIEGLSRRKLPDKQLQIVNQISFLLLLSFGLLIILKDLWQYDIISGSVQWLRAVVGR